MSYRYFDGSVKTVKSRYFRDHRNICPHIHIRLNSYKSVDKSLRCMDQYGTDVPCFIWYT